MNEEQVKIMIIEDNPIIAYDLESYMRDFGYQSYSPIHSAEEAMLFLKDEQPDLILLDVHLEGNMDGIQLAEFLRTHYEIPIIYITAHHDRQTVDRIKATRPDAYLVKPIDEYNLQASIEIALYNFFHASDEKSNEHLPDDFAGKKHFFIKVKNKLKKIQIEDILWAEAFDNYSFIQTEENRYLISSTLKSVGQKLESYSFFRVHRSFVVNLDRLSGIENEHILISGKKVPIGKTYKQGLMAKIQLL